VKRRSLVLELTDEEAAVFDAVRSLWPQHPVLKERVTDFLHLAARDRLVVDRIAETGAALPKRRWLRSVG
jgi:hypothetical protein